MLKSKTVGSIALATMMVAGVFVSGGASVHAAKPADGETPVTYENRTVLPDSNANYGMIIPTALSFTDDKKSATIDVEIVGINGFDLDKDWNALQVTASVKSANAYKLKAGAKEVAYSLKMANNTAAFTGATAQTVTKKFGKDGTYTPTGGAAVTVTGTVKKESGVATLTGSAPAKGSYADKLTFSFTEDHNSKK